MSTQAHRTRKHVVVLGTNYACGDVQLRDRISFPGSSLEAGLEQLIDRDHIEEAVILSTCNRVELYAVTSRLPGARDELLGFLSRSRSVSRKSLVHHTYYYHCSDAVLHLYRVIAGLDSMVLGEAQILGQAKNAFQAAQHLGVTGPILNKLFTGGFQAGKRVRSETGIGEGLISVPSVAIDLAQKILGDLKQCSAVILGAGYTGELSAQHLTSANIGTLLFANRTYERAWKLAQRFGGTLTLLKNRYEILRECDLAISCTASPHFIIRPEQVSEIMAQRPDRPLVLIDIAAPRDIDPLVGDIPNVVLHDIDTISSVSESNSENRRQEASPCEAIVQEESQKFFGWYYSQRVLPTLVSLRRHFEDVCEQEVSRYCSSATSDDSSSSETLRLFARSFTRRLLHTPSTVLRHMAAEKDSAAIVDAVQDLFGLEKNDE